MIDAFPASAAFDVISDSLSSSDAERKEAIQKGKAIFGFTLKNKEGKEDSWYIDLKDTGEVSKEAPKKADGMATSQEVQAWRFKSADLVIGSHSFALRRRLWEACVWQSQRAKVVHVGQAEDKR
jgi:SCP-2 sterol transfer family